MVTLNRKVPAPGDFLGRCLVGECSFDASLLLPSSTQFGLPKSSSYLYGTWRDEEGHLIRALRGVHAHESTFRYVFDSIGGGQLERNAVAETDMYRGQTQIRQSGGVVEFLAEDPASFRYEHKPDGCHWLEGGLIEVAGSLVAPAIQWYNPWPNGGCYSATAKYRVSGTVLGRKVEGFVGHEIHYFPEIEWMDSPYGKGGREICWQQIANEYDDRAIEQATFAYGTEGWGFALVHDEHGVFHASTEVSVEAEQRANGYPERITYRFNAEAWTWRIDPNGERAKTIPGAPLGADGTCIRDGETRKVRFSMGNSDWWTDGRADEILGRTR